MKDLTIALENRPGALAELGEALGRAGISIEGGGAWVVNGRGVAHFLVEDEAGARRAQAAEHAFLQRRRLQRRPEPSRPGAGPDPDASRGILEGRQGRLNRRFGRFRQGRFRQAPRAAQISVRLVF